VTSTDSTQPANRVDPEQWLERHGDVLFRYALRRVRTPELAEDLVQETLLAALRGAASFEGRAAEQTWLIGILRRKIVDHFRKAAQTGKVASDAPLDDPQQSVQDVFDHRGHWAEKPLSWQGSPTALAENQEFWSAFDGCLGRLPRPLADAFTLREVESMKSQEICKILRITSSNLWTQLHRARLLLRRCLETNWFQRKG
jgi:RNA polymerase sigma-70 factor (ECF subfamily)